MIDYAKACTMSKSELIEEINKEFSIWDTMAKDGCNDSSWPDGLNMNLVRTRLVHYYRFIGIPEEDTQMDLFIPGQPSMRKLPPELPNAFMVADGKYANRFQGRNMPLIFGKVETIS